MNVKYYLKVVWLLAISLLPSLLYCQGMTNWVVKNPFKQNVFIENKGQFTEEEKSAVGEPILFYSKKGKVHLYFTKHSIVFRYDSIYEEQDQEERSTNKKQEDDNKSIKVKHLYLKMHWEGTDSNSFTEAQYPVSNYYTYNNPDTESKQLGIVANAWKKLTYRNLYNGIDVEFSYPEKGGIEYTIYAHPGSDISKLKMTYSGTNRISLMNENVKINSIFTTIFKTAPIARDENGDPVKTAFKINDNTISFVTGWYDRSKALTINNWDSSTLFTNFNKAYDLHYDNRGNVYVYGGENPYQLQKYDSTGDLLWTFNTGLTDTDFVFPGDFTVDARSESSYIVDGLSLFVTDLAIKVNSLGIPVKRHTNNAGLEMWKVSFDYCDNILVIGGGLDIQTCTLDTNLKVFHVVNVLHYTDYYQDMCMLALDQEGNAYMALDSSFYISPTLSNLLIRVPLPTLSPTKYIVKDGYHFTELYSLKYYPYIIGNPGGFNYSNGFNGMAADINMVITYDGSILKKWTPASGILQKSLKVTKYSFKWGGMDIDCGDNIYLGSRDSIRILDSSLVNISNVPLPDTVFDVRVGNNRIYACGDGFVASYSNSVYTTVPPSVSIIKSVSCTSCSGRASAILNGCTGNLPAPAYLWSNGQTTQAAVGLCPGNYSVTVSAGCNSSYTDTVTIPPPVNLSLNLPPIINKKWGQDTTITAIASNGAPPYTYTWNDIYTGSSFTVSTDSDATYIVVACDSLDCCIRQTITIDVSCMGFKVPNVFTPNDDGRNDLFEINIVNSDISSFSIIIYDRWGKEMYKSANPNEYWAGTTEGGAKAPDGVYYYIISATCQGTNYNKQGFVQLIR
jgi:gliding motility-associated-like protein